MADSAALRAPLWANLTATFLGIGRMRPGPGTWASAATMLLWAAFAHALSHPLRTPILIGLAAVVTLVGIPAATRAARTSASKDPSFVVIDEVAGQLISLIAVPLSWKTFLAGFLLCRVFYILKPPPVLLLDRLQVGTGFVQVHRADGICTAP